MIRWAEPQYWYKFEANGSHYYIESDDMIMAKLIFKESFKIPFTACKKISYSKFSGAVDAGEAQGEFWLNVVRQDYFVDGIDKIKLRALYHEYYHLKYPKEKGKNG